MYNAFKLFLRSLKRNKTMSVITIGGYAISMAVLLILLTFIIGERNVNRGFENGENIYRITRSDNKSIVPNTLPDDLKNKVPGIEKVCLYTMQQKLYKVGNLQEWAKMIATDDDFLEMFSFDFIYKSSDPTLSVKNNIILTKKFSEKLFGEKNPVGEAIEVDKSIYNIVGVVSDIPEFASLSFDFLMTNKERYVVNMGFQDESHKMLNAFVMLHSNVNYEAVNSSVANLINHWQAFNDVELSLEPLNKVYFHSLPNDGLSHANVKLIYLLISIAAVILFMTIFNYVNLMVSSGYERLTEIGIKKTTGAGKNDIFRQVLSESLFVSLLALFLSGLFVVLISPFFTDILGKQIAIDTILSQPVVLISAIMIFLFTGIISGIYPALAFSGISPLQIISHQKNIKRQRQRAGVIAVQFLITSVLIISILVIQKQLKYVKFKDPGFDSEMMVRLDLRGNASQNYKIIKEKLLAYPQIISASGSFGSPLQLPGWSRGERDVNGVKKNIETKHFWVDEDFIETFGLTIIQGRNIEPRDSSPVLINEHLYKTLEWTGIEGKTYSGDNVVGVVKDFHYENLYNEVGNLLIGKIESSAGILNVKIQGDISETLELIKKVYVEVEPEIPFTFKFYDDWLQSMYQKEEKQAGAIKVFALLAIIISCLGLIGLIEHITNKKVKEIGIRKINGAKIMEVIALLNRNVVKWVVVGFIVACPIAYYAMDKWLESFAYKTTLSWWIFALAGIIALGIALLTVSWQSWRAATRNPVEALRYE